MARQPRIFVLVLILCLFLTVNTALAQYKPLKCKGVYIKEGDHGTKVVSLCGEPDSKEEVGYTASRDGSPLLKIEVWVYGPRDGYYYYLKFIGGKLYNIEVDRY